MKWKLSLLLLLIGGVAFAGYSEFYRNAGDFLNTIGGNFKYEVTPTGLKAMLASGSNGFLIIDLRPASQYKKGHIPGAINIPYRELFSPQYINNLPKDKKIIIYCPDESISPYILALLRAAGYDAWQLKGGYRAWLHGGTVAKAPTVPPQIKKAEKKQPVKVQVQQPEEEPEDEGEGEEEGC